jgi:hypothetical protein
MRGAVLVSALLPLHAQIHMEKISYGGWPNCIRLANGQLELIATTDVGPRLLHLARPGGTNLFKEWPDQLGKTGGEEWRIYGGHRLWHAPEVRPRTYAPDNDPVQVDWDGRRLRLTQRVEASTGLQKEIEVALSTNQPAATVTHRLHNRSQWDIEVAPWALTVCQGPGRAIVPQEPPVPHSERLLPVRTMALWGYTDMQDPRYTWGTRFVQLRSDPERRTSQKVGFLNTQGWAAFARGEEVFLKRFAFDPRATYADLGCNTEIYTNGDMLELETLGPLTRVAPGATVEHVERWYLFRAALGPSDAELDAALVPLLRQTEPVHP